MYSIVPSAHKDTLSSFFSIKLSLISFGCFMTLSKTLSIILNKHEKSEQPYLVLDLIALRVSPLKLMLPMSFL